MVSLPFGPSHNFAALVRLLLFITIIALVMHEDIDSRYACGTLRQPRASGQAQIFDQISLRFFCREVKSRLI